MNPRLLLFLSLLALLPLSAQDFSDPADIIKQQYENAHSGNSPDNVEVAGQIESVHLGQPGWGTIMMKVANGREVNLVFYPRTNYYLDYKPLDFKLVQRHLVAGEYIRMQHNPDLDLSFRHIMIVNLMFVEASETWAQWLQKWF